MRKKSGGNSLVLGVGGPGRLPQRLSLSMSLTRVGEPLVPGAGEAGRGFEI